MTKAGDGRLIGRVRLALRGKPIPATAGQDIQMQAPGSPGAQGQARWAALALRVLALQADPAPRPKSHLAKAVLPMPDPVPAPVPSPEPDPEPAPAATKPRKPPRINMSTMRLEDAASLLASVAEDDAPQTTFPATARSQPAATAVTVPDAPPPTIQPPTPPRDAAQPEKPADKAKFMLRAMAADLSALQADPDITGPVTDRDGIDAGRAD